MHYYQKKLIDKLKIKVFEPNSLPVKAQFRVFGVVYNSHFQKCRYYVERLYKSLPKEYKEPDIRGMLDVEWAVFIKKLRRKGYGSKIWALKEDVAVFLNDECMGDDNNLLRFIDKTYRMHIARNFEMIGNLKFIEHLRKQSEQGRNFVYFTISIDERVVGSLLFQIYSDLVPQFSEAFLGRIMKKSGSYVGKPIQRIAKSSWIQCGGWSLKHYSLSCENYVVPHDRRGVLSMCHNGKHVDNSTQFFITLNPTPWMDYKYVAFGQLIQGEEILNLIEAIPTHHEIPSKNIKIVKTGEFSFYPTQDDKSALHLEKFLSAKDSKTFLHPDIAPTCEVKSEMLRRKYNQGFYHALTDLRCYLPFLHLPQDLLYNYLYDSVEIEENEEMLPKDVYTNRRWKIEPPIPNFSYGKCVETSKRFLHDGGDMLQTPTETETLSNYTSTGTSSDASSCKIILEDGIQLCR